jgi:hypothetical protein
MGMALVLDIIGHCLWHQCGNYPHTLLRGCKLVQPPWKTVWRFIKKLKIELPYDPVIPLLDIYPREHKIGYSRHTCTPMFITALFTIAKLLETTQVPYNYEWIKILWYIYTMEYYSVIKNNDMPFEGKWMQLEDIMLSEVSQDQKHKATCFLSYMDDRSKDKQIHKNKHDHIQTQM